MIRRIKSTLYHLAKNDGINYARKWWTILIRSHEEEEYECCVN